MYYYLICCTLLHFVAKSDPWPDPHGLATLPRALNCRAGSEPASCCPPSCLLSLIHDFYNIWLFRNGSRVHMQQVFPRVVFANSFGVSYFCFASFVVRFDHPAPHFLFFLHTPFVAQCACLLLCSCSCFDAPVYLSAASALLTGCACPHASSQRFLVDVAILVQLWHRRLTSTLARMCCLTTSSLSISVTRLSAHAGGDFWKVAMS